MGNKLRLQISERYKHNVFINVVVPEGRLYEFDCILDKYENSYNDYQTLIEELSDEGFKVLFVDDNEIFEFEETHDIDYYLLMKSWKKITDKDLEKANEFWWIR